MPGERGATLAVLLLGLGAYLVSDATPIGDWLYPYTGAGYVDTFLGNLCWIGGLVALLHHVFHRLAEHDERVEIFDALLRWPITLVVPLMLAAMYSSHPLALAPVPDIGDAPADLPLVVYRALYYGLLAYLCGLLLRALLIVRREGTRECRRAATVYMVSAATILGGLCTRVLSYVHGLGWMHAISPVTRCCAVIGVAAAAAGSWDVKRRKLNATPCAEDASVSRIECDGRPDSMRS